MRLIITFLMAWCLSWGAYAATAPDSKQITQELEQAKAAKPAQPEVVEALQSALNALEERKGSLERIKQYQEVIDNYPKLSATLRAQLNNMRDEPRSVSPGMSNDALNQEILQISSQLLDKSRQAQQEQERAREIADSLNQLPQQQTDARRQLNEIERRLGTLTGNTPLNQAQNFALQSDSARLKALVDELELAQLSANNRQELARLRSELAEKESQQLDAYLQALRNQLNSQRQQEAERALESTEQLAESSADLPKDIVAQFKINRELSAALNQQAQRMDLVASQQRQAASQTLQVRQALNTLREQSQWLGSSNLLGEALRAQVARLPEMPKPQQLDTEMAQLRVQRLRYEDLLNKQPLLRQIHQADGQPLTAEQNRILEAQLRTQRELLNSLLQGGDTLLLELTKLKVSNGQLEDALKEVNEATHRYLFWTSDVRPMTIAWPLEIAQDLRRLISLDTFSQLGKASVMMLTSKETILPLFGALILVGCSIYSRRYFTRFLERSAAKVGKVTQDHFWLTLRTLFWSILVASPLPVLWMTLGYGLREAWPYPLAVAIGDGVTATVPLLWVVMICATFARPNGLFIAHFGWPRERVSRGMRYYLMSIGLIVPLIMALMMFDNLDDREFSGSLGRLCFILICGALAVVTLSLKKAGIPLYLNKEGSGDNITNHMLWNMMIGAPLVAILASAVGYLATAQALLARLETSVAIWFLLLVVYHVIRRWMLIQRRRLAFDRAKHRRAEMLAQRARGEEEAHHHSSPEGAIEVDESEVDLDAISAQSLRLVRSILMLIALLSVIVLWSEIHSAFGFLENISLWDVTSTVQGVESLEPITLGAVLIAILVFIITTQLVRNLPALLELAILQHLDLTPGTGYAITFARPNGLFIAHFGWPRERVSRGMRYYLMSIGLIVPLIMALMMFDNLDDREFSGSLGRLCFILICGALAVVTLSLKKAGIPLYLNKEGSGDNITNHMLWNMMIGAPLVAILASAVGYLATAQALLARLETSVAIWFLLLVVYHVIRRWMLIQRRRLAFDRAKHRRAEMLAQRARGEEEAHHHSSPEGAIEVDESEVDLDAISAQSLRLVRSILMLIALLSVIVLWSEIHSAFGFLENISLWDVTSTVQGVESLEPITLGAVLIAILVFIITTQLVRNLPALLELAILQHLDLTPGTGYAITTITKYLLMLIGGLVGFSMIGIEWSKLQWLVAALGVGLGFGLQEIFANFISGLIILFEKPIRIGDTVTIRDLTGSVTKINTRATTISDWDRKEIIVPNKAFITEQFINWSLSDSVTRVVLTIPAPADANSEEVTEILLTAARRCSLVIDNPAPEVFLVDLQQGIQIFELRIYAAEMGHRMPLRHEIHQLILAGFHAHGIDMPFPPFQMRLESLNGKQTGRTLTSAGKGRQAGSL